MLASLSCHQISVCLLLLSPGLKRSVGGLLTPGCNTLCDGGRSRSAYVLCAGLCSIVAATAVAANFTSACFFEVAYESMR